MLLLCIFFDFYQFWLGQPDEAVEKLLKIYTILDKNEMEDIIQKHIESPEKRLAQKKLAYEVTKIVHGKENAEAVKNLTKMLFDKNTNFAEFTADEINEFAEFLPAKELGVDLIDALVATSLVESKKKAREFLAQGAISVNGDKVKETLIVRQPAIVKKGKNKFLIIA